VVDVAELVLRLRVPGVDLDGLLQLRERGVRVATRDLGAAEAEPHRGGVGVLVTELGEVRDREVGLPGRYVLQGADWEQKGTGNSVVVEKPRTEVKQVTWKLQGAGIEAQIAGLEPDSHIYLRLKGKRTFDVRYVAPAGYSGEKHEYTMSVDNVVWKKGETEYFHEMTILEEELADDYVLAVEGDPREKISAWEKHQDTAEDLGWGLSDRIYDPTKRPFEDLVKSFQRIRDYMNTVDHKGGDAPEAIAWLKLFFEWSHLPPNPVSGDLDKERQEKVVLSRAAKVRMAEVNLIDRLKSGELHLLPSDADTVLKATDGVLSEKLVRTAADSGRFPFAWELSVSIFRSKETADWKRTSLSSLKSLIVSNPKFFDDFTEDALAAAPGQLRDAVKEFTAGNFMATRNAVAVLEELKKAKPGTKWIVPVGDAIAELKKK